MWTSAVELWSLKVRVKTVTEIEVKEDAPSEVGTTKCERVRSRTSSSPVTRHCDDSSPAKPAKYGVSEQYRR
jgi:hypothetical protein